MEDRKIYEDIALRTEGDIYIGVVGPVRTGKSTFIKRFMETLVIPNIENVYRRERARDELPQSGSGRTIMTAEPKFVPEEAVEIAMETMEERTSKEGRLRDYLMEQVMEKVPFTRINGSRTERLSNNVNFAFQFIEGESLLIKLDMAGICGSSGSACTSGSLDPSHVLLAIGLPHEIAHGSLRLTLSEENTMEEMDYVAEQIRQIVEYLRGMSPLYEDYLKKR